MNIHIIIYRLLMHKTVDQLIDKATRDLHDFGLFNFWIFNPLPITKTFHKFNEVVKQFIFPVIKTQPPQIEVRILWKKGKGNENFMQMMYVLCYAK